MASLDWRFEPDEAIDAIVFCNAVSRREHYASRHPGLRDRWAAVLGPEALALDDEGVGVSMSGLAQLLHACGVATLDGALAALARWDTLRPRVQAVLGPGDKRPSALRPGDAAALLGAVRDAGFVAHWREAIRPELEAGAVRLGERAAALPLDDLHRALTAFLGVDRPPAGTSVRLAWYIRPIAFQLPGGAMAAHPDDVPDVARLGQLCIHESLHGFPGAEAALLAQRRLLDEDPAFAEYHRGFGQRWQSGNEEHLVTGAEVYLTEKLSLRSREECLDHLRRQNGGMPFAQAVYERLHAAGPSAADTPWPGFGPWVAAEMAEGRLRWPGTTGADG